MIEYAQIGMDLAPIGVIAGAGWWFRRWVKSVDDRQSKLEQQFLSVVTQNALAQGEQTQSHGRFQQIQIALDNQRDKIAGNTGNIQAIWKVLETTNADAVNKRLSDQRADR